MKLLSVIYKEFLILIRDIPGLALLFVMPAILIMVITLTQEKALSEMKQSKIDILFVDNDGGQLSKKIEKGLKDSDFYIIIKEINGERITSKKAESIIAQGKYQAGIIIPKNASIIARERAKAIIDSSLSDVKKNDSVFSPDSLANVTILLDPSVNDLYRYSVSSSLKGIVHSAEIQILIDNFFAVLPEKLSSRMESKMEEELTKHIKTIEENTTKQLKSKFGEYGINNLDIKIPHQEINISEDLSKDIFFPTFPKNNNIVKISESFAKIDEAIVKPSPIQNNVPAFALFAMFFIVIPLSGSIITEKNEGTYNRIRILPISYFTLLSGKVIVYIIVCLFQFLFMVMCGTYIFPGLFGIEALETGNNIFAIFVSVIASGLAAIGFGLLIGTICNTHGQAALFGALMNIILCVLGGVFMPVYLMPDLLDKISVFTPIRWGIDCFTNLFVREVDIVTVLPDIIKLILFFIVAQIISLFTFVRRY